MEYLYDMGYLINRSMYRVLKNEGYLYDQNVRKYTSEELTDLSLMSEEAYKDVMKFIKGELELRGISENTYTLCFDDKEYQLRPEYKHRQTPEFNKELKRRVQEKLLELPETPHFRKAVGYGLEADDWIYCLRLENSKQGKHTCFYTSDCDLLCNIDNHTTGVFFKARTSNEINRDSWDAAIGSIFRYELPYNAVWLYKVTVGDHSDNIAGIARFGDKAFGRLVEAIEQAGIPFAQLNTLRGFTAFLEHPNGLGRFLTESQYLQAMEAWKLVAPITVEQAKELLGERPAAIHMQ